MNVVEDKNGTRETGCARRKLSRSEIAFAASSVSRTAAAGVWVFFLGRSGTLLYQVGCCRCRRRRIYGSTDRDGGEEGVAARL